MARVERDIVVNAPLQQVYNQWTQFEEFPRFMEGVEEVRQLDDRRLFWHAKVGGQDAEWEAEIQEQVPDQRIAWRSTSGRSTAGLVQFEQRAAGETNIHLAMEYETEGAMESVGESLGMIESRIEGDLERFKEFIESRGTETGAWRGEIHGAAGQDPARDRAEERQREPGAMGGAPGGQARVDETSGHTEPL